MHPFQRNQGTNQQAFNQQQTSDHQQQQGSNHQRQQASEKIKDNDCNLEAMISEIQKSVGECKLTSV